MDGNEANRVRGSKSFCEVLLWQLGETASKVQGTELLSHGLEETPPPLPQLECRLWGL